MALCVIAACRFVTPHRRGTPQVNLRGGVFLQVCKKMFHVKHQAGMRGRISGAGWHYENQV